MALKCYFQSLEMSERNGDKFVSVALNNIGFVFFKLEDYDKAISYYAQSLNLRNMRQ